MPSERTRNTIVGLTLLVAGAILMYAIFALGKFNALVSGAPYIVRVNADNAGGLAPGSKVDMAGVYVGSVQTVALASDLRSADLTLALEDWVKVPVGTVAVIGRPYVGTPFISLKPPAGTSQSSALITRDGSGSIVAEATDGGLIPKTVIDELGALSKKLSLVSDDLHDLLQARPTSVVDAPGDGKSGRPLANISTLVQRIDHLSAGLDKLVNDQKLQGSVRQIVSNVQDSTAELKGILESVKGTLAKADGTIDKIGGAATQASSTLQTTQERIVVVSEKLVETLASMQKIMDEVASGNGTAGRLVNDPRLYEGLVDVTTSLKSTLDELKVLVRKWKEEGVNLKL